jgi:hypothetical protein
VTWVVGSPTIFGYAMGVSDIRVTWPSGATLDCLQKIYPVGNFIAAGFAGSVEFGFWAIGDLQRYLRLDEPDRAWKPGWVAFKWRRRARRIFSASGEDVQRAGAAIMLLGASPDVDVGIPGYARATVAIFQSPDFFPQIVRPESVGAIGSGALVDIYAEELRRLGTDRELQQAESGGPGMYGFLLQLMIWRTIEDHPEATVSPHVHWCLVRRGAIGVGNSDHVQTVNGDLVDVRMPPVATSWEEFLELAHAAGSDAAAAIC